MLKVSILLIIVALQYSSAVYNFGPNVKKQAIYPNSAAPSDERFYGPNVQSSPQAQTLSMKGGAIPQSGQSGSFPSIPAQFQLPIKQLQFYPQQQQPQYYSPQLFPPSTGSQNFLYIPPQKYPGATDGIDQTGGGWFNYWPSQFAPPTWPQQGQAPGWPSTVPSFPPFTGNYPFGPSGSAPTGSGTPDAVVTTGTELGNEGNYIFPSVNKVKPEKLEITETSQDGGKADSQKNSIELPPQQYYLVGQPQYFNQFAALQNEKDPLLLGNAGKGGAISSFLIYKDQQGQILPQQRLSQQGVSQQYVPQLSAQQLFGQQILPQQLIPQQQQQQQQQLLPQQLVPQPYSQQITPQKTIDQAAIQDSASLAYQRFLLQNKQRSEEPTVKISQKLEEPTQQNETPAPNTVNNVNVNSDSTGPTGSA